MFVLDLILTLLNYLLSFYILCLFARGVLSLVGADPKNPITLILAAMSDPPCRWLVRTFPKLIVTNSNGRALDLSLLVLLLLSSSALVIVKKTSLYFGFTI